MNQFTVDKEIKSLVSVAEQALPEVPPAWVDALGGAAHLSCSTRLVCYLVDMARQLRSINHLWKPATGRQAGGVQQQLYSDKGHVIIFII